MRGIVAFVSAACATTSLFLGLTPKVDANRISIKFTIYERQTDEGPRHSPLLPVGDEEEGYPSRMVLFNNDLYVSETGLIEEDPHELIGYNQVGRCLKFKSMYVCMVITYSRVWIDRVRLPILLVVS